MQYKECGVRIKNKIPAFPLKLISFERQAVKKSTLFVLLILFVGGFTLLHRVLHAPAAASQWPAGAPLTCVVPWSAGGSADTMARQLCQYWEPELGTNVAIRNIDGAATLTGTKHFLEQPDDGSTIYIGTQMYLSSCILRQDAEFTMDDFAIINFQQFDPVTLAVREDSPYKTLHELIADIATRPGEFKCGLIPGGAPHLASEFLKQKLGLDYQDVPFDSGNAYRTALLGRDVDFIVSTANGDRAIQGGARVLAVGDVKRSGIWPEAPTFNEALGIDDFPQLGSARFIAVRRGVLEKHPARFWRLVETYRDAFEHPEYAAFRESVGESAISAYRGPEASSRMNNGLHLLLELYAP